jgi:hypothetical protein
MFLVGLEFDVNTVAGDNAVRWLIWQLEQKQPAPPA